MKVLLRLSDEVKAPLAETLLGQNLEVALDTMDGLLSDRLKNSKFRGPPACDQAVPAPWMGGGLGGRITHVPGAGLNGSDALLIHDITGRPNVGILQPKIKVRAGETFEVSLWARCQHHPVKIRVGLRPVPNGLDDYSSADLEVGIAYYSEYKATLTSPRDDDEAVFYLHVMAEGELWLDQVHVRPAGMGPFRKDLLEAFRTLRIPVLRFPGGCLSTCYHWRHGAQPLHMRPILPDAVFKWQMSYEFGPEEYLALCLDQGIRPQITINIGTGTPEEAGEWAAWSADWFRRQGVEPPVAYWQMANEISSVHEIGHMTGEKYVEALREFVPAVRKGYPRARIIALGEEVGYPNELSAQPYPWRSLILEQCPELVDVLAVHPYCFSKQHPEDPRRQYLESLRSSVRLTEYCRKTTADCVAHGKHAAATEWNLWSTAVHHDGKWFQEPYDAEHVVFIASMFNSFFRMAPGMELVNFYHLLNPMGVFISRGPKVEETALADFFRLYRPVLPGSLMGLEVHGPLIEEGIPVVDAVQVRCGDGDHVLLVNRSAEEAVDCDVGGRVAEFKVMAGRDLRDEALRVTTERVAGTRVTLPLLSVSRCRMAT
jgi:alpha-L-arabinofuranosidase